MGWDRVWMDTSLWVLQIHCSVEEAPPLEADRAGPFKAQSTGHFSGLRTMEIITLIVIFSNVNGVFIYYGSVLSPLCIHLILITTQRRGTFTIIPI